MHLSFVLSLLSLLALTTANPQYNVDSNDRTTSTSSSPAPSATSDVSPSIHSVTVGANAFTFSPSTLSAPIGDIVEFTIHATHSVARSSFNPPCQPLTGGGEIWSGFSSSDDTIFSVTINTTEPMWLYCAAPTHCQVGMVMVVNPPTSGGNTFSAYQAAAKGTSDSGTPANIAGGVFGRPVAVSSSTAGGSASANPTASAGAAQGVAGSLVVDMLVLGGVVLVGMAWAM